MGHQQLQIAVLACDICARWGKHHKIVGFIVDTGGRVSAERLDTGLSIGPFS